MGGQVENLHTELSAARRHSQGELEMVVVMESYDSVNWQESRSCSSSFQRDSSTGGCAFKYFNTITGLSHWQLAWLTCYENVSESIGNKQISCSPLTRVGLKSFLGFKGGKPTCRRAALVAFGSTSLVSWTLVLENRGRANPTSRVQKRAKTRWIIPRMLKKAW